MFARQLARTTVAFNRSTQPLISKRFMAHSREEGLKEVEKWKKVSIGMTGLVILLSLKEVVSSEEHGHGPEELPSYMRIRSKPFPWSCTDCSPFDSACMKACKESK